MTDEEFMETWKSLSDNQQRFVEAYLTHTTKKAAAEAAGFHQDTVYEWDVPVEKLTKHIRTKRMENTMDALEGLSEEATQTLARHLDPEEETDRTAQEAAEYIINRLEGKPTQKQEVKADHDVSVSEEDIDEAIGNLPSAEEESSSYDKED